MYDNYTWLIFFMPGLVLLVGLLTLFFRYKNHNSANVLLQNIIRKCVVFKIIAALEARL